MHNINQQFAFGGITKMNSLLVFLGLLCGQLISPDGRNLGFEFSRLATFMRCWWWQNRIGILKINTLIFMNIHHREFIILVEELKGRE